MTIHADGTMDVRIDGTIQRRPYQVNLCGTSHNPYCPEQRDGERVVWTMGDLVPTIVRLATTAYQPSTLPEILYYLD